MRHIPTFLKNLIKTLLAGTFTIIVAACYGVYMDYRNFFFNVKTPQGDPIPGIQLDLIHTEQLIDRNLTDESGHASLDSYLDYEYGEYIEYTVLIQDIDGPGNLGEFQSQSMTVTNVDSEGPGYDITLYPAK